MMPTRSRTARHSSCGSVYQRGLRHGPRSTMRAPSASCFRWRGVRLTGMWGGPARAPRGTGRTGGRAVVAPISRVGRLVRRAADSTSALWHIFPWQGPIVTVLYRLSVWTSSNPSSTAWTTSDSVMSSQMQTKRRCPSAEGATATSVPSREKEGRRFGPPPAAGGPAGRPSLDQRVGQLVRPGDAPGGVDTLGQGGRRHPSRRAVPAHLRAAHLQQGAGGQGAGGHADEVTVEAALLAGGPPALDPGDDRLHDPPSSLRQHHGVGGQDQRPDGCGRLSAASMPYGKCGLESTSAAIRVPLRNRSRAA